MELNVINDRADLDAIQGTAAHMEFMGMLAGTLWRIQKDDDQKQWVAVEDNSVIARFGFTRSDFQDVSAPELPQYVEPTPVVPSRVTRAQGKVVLIQMGLWPAVLGFVASIEDLVAKAVAEVALHDTQHWERSSPFLTQAGEALGMTSAELDELFIQADQVQL
jgi:hypothetical protein